VEGARFSFRGWPQVLALPSLRRRRARSAG
jgi:hypothetical protein